MYQMLERSLKGYALASREQYEGGSRNCEVERRYEDFQYLEEYVGAHFRPEIVFSLRFSASHNLAPRK